MTIRILLTVIFISPCLLLSAAAYEVKPISSAQLEKYELDPEFYKKGTMVEGILIATSSKVSDHTHLEAAYLFGKLMTALRPEISGRIRNGNVLCVLVGHNELTSQVPQFTSDKIGEELDYYNWRSRGFLTKIKDRPVVLFAEEDVMEYKGGMQLESILIHEFGHVIQRPGFDQALDDRLKETHAAAMEEGLWQDGLAAQKFKRVESEEPVSLHAALVKAFPKESSELLKKCLDSGDILVNSKPTNSEVSITKEDKVVIVFGGKKACYATTNRAEYWAEGVQCWFNTNRTMDHDHNHIHTREQLKKYDPRLAQLCSDILGDDAWRFVPVRERAGKDHLSGYNPKTAPVVKTLPNIKKASLDYYDTYWHDYWQRLYDKHSIPRPSSE